MNYLLGNITAFIENNLMCLPPTRTRPYLSKKGDKRLSFLLDTTSLFLMASMILANTDC